ncbi:MAG: hypothetical protein ABIH71_06065 [Candidatus Omnitrophota bacterium]|nr:hypothetical protein [Candidatus Omnitrophota bacterium]
MKNFLLLVTVVFLLTGCVRLHRLVSQYELPVQSLQTQRQEGKTRVFFYNATAPSGFDFKDKIDIVLDGKNVGSIIPREYIVVNLKPAEYELNLTHYDVFKFSNTYKLKISGEDMFVKVYNGIFKTKYKLDDQFSVKFDSWYKPAYQKH